MATRAGLFLILLLQSAPLTPEGSDRFIVWNVGQGLWTTGVTTDVCLHFDMGGERAPWNGIMDLCRKRSNSVHLSHWDTDHLSFVGKARYFLPRLCRLNEPPFAPSTAKLTFIRRVPVCPSAIGEIATWQPADRGSSNGQSVVVQWRKMLIPGDSTSAEEKVWSEILGTTRQARVLVLGHHGSKSSTSEILLTKMPHLRLALASARKRRYGHPHRRIIDRARKFGIPVLSTEDWGSIHVWL